MTTPEYITITAFARICGVSAKTLRFYDAVELLTPAYVDRDSGYRYYSAEQVRELGQILHLKALGFSLSEIQTAVTQSAGPAGLRPMLEDKRRELARRLRDDRLRLAGLDGWLEHIAGKREAPAHTVTLKRVGPQRVVSLRKLIACYADAVNLFDELGSCVRRGGAAARPPAAIWHTCGESGGAIDCEAHLPVRHPVLGGPHLTVKEVPSTMVASVVHQGNSETCAAAYVAARSWIASNGYRISGPKCELYWRGGLDQDRTSDITEIQFPVTLPGPGRRRERPDAGARHATG